MRGSIRSSMATARFHHSAVACASSFSSVLLPRSPSLRLPPSRVSPPPTYCAARLDPPTNSIDQEEQSRTSSADDGERRDQSQSRSADWRAARAHKESGVVFNGRVVRANNGGLLIRFYSLLGFLPYPLLSPSHNCKDPQRAIQDVAKDLVGSTVSVKVIEADENAEKLIFSEKEAYWDKYSSQVNVGDVFDAMVGSVEDYGAFVHLQFPHGSYHLTGLVHLSEVSWDLVQDVNDFLSEGDLVKVKVTDIDREKSRIKLSIKQLEEDPLLETLDKVISKDESQIFTDSSDANFESLPGLAGICQELLNEEGITDVQLGRQGIEKRVVSQDLELWLSSALANGKQYTVLARAGRLVQEVYVTSTLDQDGIKKALQRILERIP